MDYWKVVLLFCFTIFTIEEIDAESRKPRSADKCQQTGFPWYFDDALKQCCPCEDCGRSVTYGDPYHHSCLKFHEKGRPSDEINRLCPTQNRLSCCSLQDVIANACKFPFKTSSTASKANTTTTVTSKILAVSPGAANKGKEHNYNILSIAIATAGVFVFVLLAACCYSQRNKCSTRNSKNIDLESTSSGASHANPSNNIPGPFNVTFPSASPTTVNVVHGNQYNYITNTVPMAERQAQPNVHTLGDTMRAESFNFSTNDSEISLKIPKEPKATVEREVAQKPTWIMRNDHPSHVYCNSSGSFLKTEAPMTMYNRSESYEMDSSLPGFCSRRFPTASFESDCYKTDETIAKSTWTAENGMTASESCTPLLNNVHTGRSTDSVDSGSIGFPTQVVDEPESSMEGEKNQVL